MAPDGRRYVPAAMDPKCVLRYTSAPDVLERAPLHYPAHSARCDEFHARGDLLMVGVFADPQAEDFASIAKALEPLSGQGGVETVLLPQGDHRDPEVAERLRTLGFRCSFLPDRMSEAYTLSLLPDATRPPAVTLQTNEGRLLYAARWSEEALPALKQALAESFKEPAKR